MRGAVNARGVGFQAATGSARRSGRERQPGDLGAADSVCFYSLGAPPPLNDSMDPDTRELEHKLQHKFQRPDLLRRALTHKSRAFEMNARSEAAQQSNEQLEFLGDAILGFLVAEALVERFPALSEGRLSKIRARLVSADHLHEVALQLELGRFLLLGHGEEMDGGRRKRALLANAAEALIAAIYLDGGYAPARRFVLEEVIGDLEALAGEERQITDFKGALQELAQSLKLPAPRYRVSTTSGPEHSKRFTVEARIGERWSAQAEGNSKKSAGQRAAAILLKQMTAERPESVRGRMLPAENR